MEDFLFSAFHGSAELHIQQESTQAIGFKLYPGALLLCDYLEKQPELVKGKHVLELGAGACGLPSLALAASLPGTHCYPSDLQEVLRVLEVNVENNKGSWSGTTGKAEMGSSCKALPLAWGIKEQAAEVGASIRGSQGPDVIVAADVVYHDWLIDPLLETLLALTDTPAHPSAAHAAAAAAGAGAGGGAHEGASAAAAAPLALSSSSPPPIIMAYVQRFKKAKAFFKKAGKHFQVEQQALGLTVDYEALSWRLPLLHKHALAAQRALQEVHGAKAVDGSSGSSGSGSSGLPFAAGPVGRDGLPLVRLDSSTAFYHCFLQRILDTADLVRKAEAEVPAALAAARLAIFGPPASAASSSSASSTLPAPAASAAVDGAAAAPERKKIKYKRRSSTGSTSSSSSEELNPLAVGVSFAMEEEEEEGEREEGGLSSTGAGAGAGAEDAGEELEASGKVEAAFLLDKRLVAAAVSACRYLGMDPVPSSKAYLYILRRKQQLQPAQKQKRKQKQGGKQEKGEKKAAAARPLGKEGDGAAGAGAEGKGARPAEEGKSESASMEEGKADGSAGAAAFEA